MHPFFEPLDHRETMLLLTTLTAGGSEEVGIFDRLPGQSRGRLREKARALLAIPREKRIPFIVHEMKQALDFKGLRGAEKVDASWLLQGLEGESPRVVAAVLASLPPPTVRAVLEKLPPGIRHRLPAREALKVLPVELVRSIRQIFESRFEAMPRPSTRGLAFRDLVQLERADLYRLLRDLGLIELGQAFVSVGKLALAELCRRLPRASAEELVLAVRSAPSADLPELKSAQRFLSRVAVSFKDTEELFQKAGLWRLAKATPAEDTSFRAAFRQRLPREAGELFDNYLERATEMGDVGEEVQRRLQDGVLLRLGALAARNELSARWAEVELLLHDRDAARAGTQPGRVRGSRERTLRGTVPG